MNDFRQLRLDKRRWQQVGGGIGLCLVLWFMFLITPPLYCAQRRVIPTAVPFQYSDAFRCILLCVSSCTLVLFT